MAMETPVKVVPAREGREKQRYHEDGRRLTVGCIVKRGHEVLMISSAKDQNKLIIPKGGWEEDETLEEGAARETLEEAGIEVKLGRIIGWFDCPSGCATNKGTRLCVFEAECVRELDDWAEAGHRCRKWASLASALSQCKHSYLIPIIKMGFEAPL